MLNPVVSNTEKPHEQRVVLEANELALKINGLDKFVSKENKLFMDLDCYSKTLLMDQLKTMKKYHVILLTRIEIFA